MFICNQFMLKIVDHSKRLLERDVNWLSSAIINDHGWNVQSGLFNKGFDHQAGQYIIIERYGQQRNVIDKHL